MSTINDPKNSLMHVAIVIPSLHGGGAEFAARQWITELRAQGHSITVYVYDRKQPNINLPPGTAIHRLSPRGGLFRLPLMLVWLRYCIRRDHPNVVLSLMTLSNIVSLLALKVCPCSAVPLMVSERNVQSLQAANIRRRDRLMVRLARYLYRRASGALAISHPVAVELVSAFRVPASRVFVVPNPVVPSSSQTGVIGPHIPKHVHPKHVHLVLVGRQARQKRPHLFLAVLQELAQHGITVRGTVIGDGPLRESTEIESSRLGLNVSFLGWKEPWWEAVSGVDCLVLTANAEGFANVLVEAAAAGIPSVASSRALGVADAIVPGITGEFAIDDSPQAYADAVLRAISLVIGSTVHIDGWLNHFSTTRSTATLLAALSSVAEQTSLQAHTVDGHASLGT